MNNTHDKGNGRKRLKQAIGLFLGLLFIFSPLIGFMGIKYSADVYSRKRSMIVDDCVVKAVVEAPKEILFAVELPDQWYSFWPEMRVVHAYGRWEKDRQEVAIGDTVTCAFPDRNTGIKGYVVW